jgi:hypothetical protein
MSDADGPAPSVFKVARSLAKRWLWPEPRLPRPYTVVPVSSASTDVRIEHRSGVVIEIEHDGRVVVHTPSALHLHADGDLAITSDTHIGLAAPRIDLN